MHRVAEIATEIPKATPGEVRDALSAYRGQLLELSAALWGIGIVVSAFVFVGVLAAVLAQRNLREQYRNHPFQLGISAGTTIAGQAVAVSVPLICMLAWKIIDAKLRGAA
jgi:tellurite resistance protein TehA-like permease